MSGPLGPIGKEEYINDEVLDRWEQDGERPLMCNALFRRIQAQVESTMHGEEQFVPSVLLDLYEMGMSEFEDAVSNFQAFCALQGVQAEPYLHLNKLRTKGQPVELAKMKNLLQITLLLLCQKLKIDTKIFPGLNMGLSIVGGVVYTHAEALAGILCQKLRG